MTIQTNNFNLIKPDEVYTQWVSTFDAKWSVSINLKTGISGRYRKTNDYYFDIRRILIKVRNQLNREFCGRYTKDVVPFVGIIEGLKDGKNTHFHLILGNLDTENIRLVKRRIESALLKIKEIDSDVPCSRSYKRRVTYLEPGQFENCIDDVTGKTHLKKIDESRPDIVLGNLLQHKKKSRAVKIRRIYSDGWSDYVCKEIKWNEGINIPEDLIQVKS